MFQDLDTAIGDLLNLPGAPAELSAADVSFVTPDAGFNPGVPTVNFFLYELEENRELRGPYPIEEKIGQVFVTRPAPLRVNCTYLVTAWANNLMAGARVIAEHRLLAQAIMWLTRFPTLPASLFVGGSLANPPFPPPTLVAQMDANKNAGEFWSALGVRPRPAFHLTVTIALDLGIQIPEGPPVVTKEMVMKARKRAGVPDPVMEEFYVIAGTVRSSATLDPIAGAQVTLVERGWSTQTDQEGHFRFSE